MFIKDFNKKIPKPLLPEIKSKSEIIDGEPNWEIIKTTFNKNKIVSEFIDWVQDNSKTDISHSLSNPIDLASWASKFWRRKKESDTLTKLCEVVFPQYQFDLSRRDGLVVEVLTFNQGRQATNIWSSLLRNTLLRNIDIHFMKVQFDAVFRTLMRSMDTETPYTQLETQKKTWFKADTFRRGMIQSEIRDGFEKVKEEHKETAEYIKATDTNKQWQEILLDCIRDIFMSFMLSKETLLKINSARRLQSDVAQVIFDIPYDGPLSQEESTKNDIHFDLWHSLFSRNELLSVSERRINKIYLQLGNECIHFNRELIDYHMRLQPHQSLIVTTSPDSAFFLHP